MGTPPTNESYFDTFPFRPRIGDSGLTKTLGFADPHPIDRPLYPHFKTRAGTCHRVPRSETTWQRDRPVQRADGV
ncbi:hypothetical protein CHLRE_17g713305v5 [Chlamydomonas reinhardtii]|uniref:Uncharacterized protein n=1 Tax=Chlamydomonas reinhardtii TaxID=3055 RepID=A0A2K3CPR5_CHLRE|nr:uncharacterized protein CHLRE_17g713305v5 [Chlamydomonas reinhardtii]PNW70281.1 hypothetical protein CHLRE_17g713305v5 [Chlamydomonas reinhardtii]